MDHKKGPLTLNEKRKLAYVCVNLSQKFYLADENKSFTWLIENVKQLSEDQVSPVFFSTVTSDIEWNLVIKKTIKPKLEDENPEFSNERKENTYIGLYIQTMKEICGLKPPILRLSFCITNPLEGNLFCKSKILYNVIEKTCYGFQYFISVKELEECGQEDLTIKCEIEQVLKDFKSYTPLLRQKIYSDIELVIADGIRYPAHKVILALSSWLFRDKLIEEESISEMQIVDIKPQMFDILLKYMYTGEIELTDILIGEIFEAAITYKIPDLLQKCKEYFCMNLKYENLVQTILATRMRPPPCLVFEIKLRKELLIVCISFIKKNFNAVMRMELCKELVKKAPMCLTKILLICKDLKKSNCRKKLYVEAKHNSCSESCHNVYKSFLNCEEFSDVTIRVKKTKYYAHKLLLATKSPIFKAIFSSKKKRNSSVLNVDDVEPELFYELLRFVYTGKVKFTKNLTPNMLLVLADKYDIEDLKHTCEIKLRDELTEKNILSTLIFADNNNAKQLKEACLQFVTDDTNGLFANQNLDAVEIQLNSTLSKSHPHLLYELLQMIYRKTC